MENKDIYGRKTYPENPCPVCGGVEYPHGHSTPQETPKEDWEAIFDKKFAPVGGDIFEWDRHDEIKDFIKKIIHSTEKRVIEEVKKWADENMADGDYTYEKLLLFLKSKYE